MRWWRTTTALILLLFIQISLIALFPAVRQQIISLWSRATVVIDARNRLKRVMSSLLFGAATSSQMCWTMMKNGCGQFMPSLKESAVDPTDRLQVLCHRIVLGYIAPIFQQLGFALTQLLHSTDHTYTAISRTVTSTFIALSPSPPAPFLYLSPLIDESMHTRSPDEQSEWIDLEGEVGYGTPHQPRHVRRRLSEMYARKEYDEMIKAEMLGGGEEDEMKEMMIGQQQSGGRIIDLHDHPLSPSPVIADERESKIESDTEAQPLVMTAMTDVDAQTAALESEQRHKGRIIKRRIRQEIQAMQQESQPDRMMVEQGEMEEEKCEESDQRQLEMDRPQAVQQQAVVMPSDVTSQTEMVRRVDSGHDLSSFAASELSMSVWREVARQEERSSIRITPVAYLVLNPPRRHEVRQQQQDEDSDSSTSRPSSR